MGPDRFWIALIDVRPSTPDNRNWRDQFGESAAGGFVHVMGLARDPGAFTRVVADSLAGYGWMVAGSEDLELLSQLKAREQLSPALTRMEKDLLATGELQFGRFFLYPVEDLSTAEWLAREAADSRLTETQSRVLSNLARMVAQLAPANLDEGAGVTCQGSELLEIHLPHRRAEGTDLTIRVHGDAEVTVDYQFGHVHFGPSGDSDWVSRALEFVFGAFQGGVKVEIWSDSARVGQSRALLLLENGDWLPLPAWTATAAAPRTDPPTISRILSFL